MTSTEARTAMRAFVSDDEKAPVFVCSDGAYSTEFPEENIVRRAGSDKTVFTVYGFIGSHGDYEEAQWWFSDKDQALEFAAGIHGVRPDMDGTRFQEAVARRFDRRGEVFEVEVHEVDQEDHGFKNLRDVEISETALQTAYEAVFREYRNTYKDAHSSDEGEMKLRRTKNELEEMLEFRTDTDE